jgi:two-component system, OmpR family, response regulator
VRSASSGPEALAMLAEPPLPDVVMLDVMMPGMSGPEVLATMRERDDLAGVPVIFMTARARKADVDSYRDLGAIGVIVKPFDPLRLAGDVRALIGAPPQG